jgi:DNA-binding FadR family transcriptional regulator
VADRILDWLRETAYRAGRPAERAGDRRPLQVGRSTVRERCSACGRMNMVQVRQGGRMRLAQPTAET